MWELACSHSFVAQRSNLESSTTEDSPITLSANCTNSLVLMLFTRITACARSSRERLLWVFTRISRSSSCNTTTERARPLPEYTHPDRALYIFGPEDGSLDKEIRDWCEDVVYIPTTGCMNLAATVNVVLYDRLAKGNNTRSGPKY